MSAAIFASWPLFGQDPRSRYTTADVFIPLGLLIGSLLIMAIVVLIMRRWYERSKNEEVGVSEFLSEARELEEEGELTREEYLKIKAKLAAQMHGLAKPNLKGGDPAKRSNPPPRQNPPDP
jgi:hypothetical protein